MFLLKKRLHDAKKLQNCQIVLAPGILPSPKEARKAMIINDISLNSQTKSEKTWRTHLPWLAETESRHPHAWRQVLSGGLEASPAGWN